MRRSDSSGPSGGVGVSVRNTRVEMVETYVHRLDLFGWQTRYGLCYH